MFGAHNKVESKKADHEPRLVCDVARRRDAGFHAERHELRSDLRHRLAKQLDDAVVADGALALDDHLIEVRLRGEPVAPTLVAHVPE